MAAAQQVMDSTAVLWLRDIIGGTLPAVGFAAAGVWTLVAWQAKDALDETAAQLAFFTFSASVVAPSIVRATVWLGAYIGRRPRQLRTHVAQVCQEANVNKIRSDVAVARGQVVPLATVAVDSFLRLPDPPPIAHEAALQFSAQAALHNTLVAHGRGSAVVTADVEALISVFHRERRRLP